MGASTDLKEKFQARVAAWGEATFVSTASISVKVRAYRFLEEALELCQSLGMSDGDALQLVDYVYSRPKGEPKQEVGGTLVTLAFLCEQAGLDMGACGEAEYNRINTPAMMGAIRAKDARKPLQDGPLPGTYNKQSAKPRFPYDSVKEVKGFDEA